jgi:anionic cell wall polymer biosynthesis LytR-Cps2A-Psr (LCP) family protein
LPRQLFLAGISAGPAWWKSISRIAMINVVFLGLHNRTEENTFGEIYYVDTILVASINFDQNNLSLLAIPRDSHIEIAHSGIEDRIRQSYSYGYEQSHR